MSDLDVAEVRAKLGLDSKDFDQGINNVLGKFSPVGKGALGVSMIATAAVGAIGYAAVKMGAEFDEAYDTIRLGTGATGARLDGLEDSFKQVVQDVPASFGDASAAITGLNQRMGITGPRLRELSDQFLNLSRITKSDVADNVRLGTRLFGDWSIKTGAQAGALDQLYRATQQSGIGLSDLMSTVVQFGAPLRNMGFSFGDSIAMLSKWEKEGVNITTVLAGMRFALKRFAAEGVDPAQGLAKAIDEIAKAKTRAAAMKIGSDIFGMKGASDTVAAIREGRFQYQKFADTIANGSDTIATAAKDTEDLGESWTMFANTLKVKAEPALTGIFQGLTNVMKHPFSSVTGLFDPSADENALSTLEAHLAKLRAKFAEKMAAGDFDTADILDAIALTEGKLGILRDHFIAPMAVGHVKNALWIKGINQGVSREQYFRGIMKNPMAVGHVQNAFWLNGINQGVTRAQYFKSLLANPMYVGHLDPSGWLSGISQAQAAFSAFKSGVAANMYVGHVVGGGKPDGGGALGGTFTGPKSGYYTLMHGKETIVAHDNPARGLKELAKYGLSGSGGGASFTFGSVSVILPPGDYGDSEDAGSAAADAFMQRTREIARGY